MIAACPKCSARYRIEKGKLRPEGARLRCSRCEAVFRVRPPEAEAVPAARAPAVPQPVPLPAAPTHSSRVVTPVPTAPTSEEGHDRSRLVLVADPVIEEGKATASALAAWGLQPILVHDGVEAMLTIQRTLPCAVIIDAALPKMYGFQVCEVLKRNESLRSIHVVLVGAIHDRTRYRRSPTELYGADAYLERPQLPNALWPILREFGISLAGAAPPPEAPQELPYSPASASLQPRIESPAETIAPPEPIPDPPTPSAVPVAAAQLPLDPQPGQPAAAAAPVGEADIAKAERLARIVVSDIILYNQEKFDAAVSQDNVVMAMDAELAEGRTLFSQRIEARVREQRDFLGEELLRVAGLRRTQ
ncbi:MAG: zinc-ribbon domain-containing protein [Deltaproteobacteria bacterium]|nr:zinc-ribbon domain-containing protein [Deltaproteobacteria bacterium]